MKTIYKYRLSIADLQTLLMPEGAKMLGVGEQADPTSGCPELFLWALVDTERDLTPTRILIRGTGRDTEDCLSHTHIATVLTAIGHVWHVFDGR